MSWFERYFMRRKLYKLISELRLTVYTTNIQGVLMKNCWILLILLVGCNVQVPKTVKQDVSGDVNTVNTIRIEISVPPTLLDAFTTTCENKCKDSVDNNCVNLCKAEQQTNYTNQILSLISMFQQTVHPSPTPNP